MLENPVQLNFTNKPGVTKMTIIKTADGHRNLFFRAKGDFINTKNGWRKQPVDAFVIQWKGTSDFDSGFHEESFATLAAAEIEFAVRIIESASHE
jgi:hypothetical protein